MCRFWPVSSVKNTERDPSKVKNIQGKRHICQKAWFRLNEFSPNFIYFFQHTTSVVLFKKNMSQLINVSNNPSSLKPVSFTAVARLLEECGVLLTEGVTVLRHKEHVPWSLRCNLSQLREKTSHIWSKMVCILCVYHISTLYNTVTSTTYTTVIEVEYHWTWLCWPRSSSTQGSSSSAATGCLILGMAILTAWGSVSLVWCGPVSTHLLVLYMNAFVGSFLPGYKMCIAPTKQFTPFQTASQIWQSNS